MFGLGLAQELTLVRCNKGINAILRCLFMRNWNWICFARIFIYINISVWTHIKGLFTTIGAINQKQIFECVKSYNHSSYLRSLFSLFPRIEQHEKKNGKIENEKNKQINHVIKRQCCFEEEKTWIYLLNQTPRNMFRCLQHIIQWGDALEKHSIKTNEYIITVC